MALEELASKWSLPIETIKDVFTSKSVNILFTGRTGVGKSTLINCLVGKVVAIEGNNLAPQTMEVQSYIACLNGVDVTVWDSPGLQDGTGNEAKYIQEMRAKCGSGCDLAVYCMKMTETRFTSDEINAIKILTNEFGQEFWANAVFVLSCANQVIQTASKKNRTGILKERFDVFKTTILKELQKCGVKEEMAKSIPIIPAGHMDMEEVGGGPELPPLTKDWLSDFWFASLMRMKESASRGMVLANANRFKKEEEITEEDRKKPASEQPIGCSKEKEEVLLKKLGIPIAVGSGVGAAVGIGAIALGVLGGPIGLIATLGFTALGGATGYYASAKKRTS